MTERRPYMVGISDEMADRVRARADRSVGDWIRNLVRAELDRLDRCCDDCGAETPAFDPRVVHFGGTMHNPGCPRVPGSGRPRLSPEAEDWLGGRFHQIETELDTRRLGGHHR